MISTTNCEASPNIRAPEPTTKMSRYGRSRPLKRTSEKDFVKKGPNSLCPICQGALFIVHY